MSNQFVGFGTYRGRWFLGEENEAARGNTSPAVLGSPLVLAALLLAQEGSRRGRRIPGQAGVGVKTVEQFKHADVGLQSTRGLNLVCV